MSVVEDETRPESGPKKLPRVDPPDPELLLPAIGALIFASGEPVRSAEIVEALGGKLDRKAVEEAVERLGQHLERGDSGLRVEAVAGGYRLTTRPEVGEFVRRLFRQRNRARLTPAALETLAIVAYRQPVTAPEIQAIRGKDPSAALKSLLDKKLVRIQGRKKVVGSPLLYGTHREFLIHFGLNNLDELPILEDFDEMVVALEAAQAQAFADSTADSPETETEAEPEESSEPDPAPDSEG